MKRLLLALFTPALGFGATLTVTPAAYTGDGYSTVVWSGAGPCVASALPAYDPWAGDVGASGGKSLSPDVSTRLILTCADGTATATITVDGVSPPGSEPPPPPTTNRTPPACWPITLGAAKVAVEVDDVSRQFFATWTCELPNRSGYRPYGFAFQYGELAQFMPNLIARTLNKAQADSAYLTQSQPMTADMESRYRTVMARFHPSAVVAINGTATTRSVYFVNAAGALSIVTGAKARVGDTCDYTRRFPGSNYYSVQNRIDAAVAGRVLGDVYAVCSMTLPVGAL